MPTSKRRNPRSFDGTRQTAHPLKELLPGFLQEMKGHYSTSADQIFAYWEQMMGPDLAKFARPHMFAGGILTVKVLNNALFALLSKQEKPKLLKRLREAFPSQEIKTIEFRIG